MMKLSKKKNDVIFIDPVTMQKVCSFNECINKFTKEGTETIESPEGSMYDTVVCYHECTQCSRRMRSKQDKKKAYKMKMDNMFTRAPNHEQD